MKTQIAANRDYRIESILRRIWTHVEEQFKPTLVGFLIVYSLVIALSVVAKIFFPAQQFDAIANLMKEFGAFWRL